MSLNKLLNNLKRIEDEENLKFLKENPGWCSSLHTPPSKCNGKHVWQPAGGRSCPYVVNTDYVGLDYCSMTVFKCKDCGEHDYGYEGGPGWKECEKCPRSGLKVREYNNAEI